MSHLRLLRNVLKTPSLSNSLVPAPLRRLLPVASHRFYGSRYEPSYLDEITYEPRYETVQLRLKGHDFPVLEQFRKLVLKFAPQ